MILSKGTKSLENSDDLLLEILLRLPSESIFKFLCVSTRWNNVITDHSFKKLYLERTRRSLACSYPHGRLLAFVQTNNKHGNAIRRPFVAKHNLMPLHATDYVCPAACGGDFFPIKKGYFITSSKDGLFLCGLIPETYYVGDPITGKWETLPPPPLPEGFPKNCLSVGLSSNEEDDGLGGKVVNFRVIIATGCDYMLQSGMIPVSKVIPIETYSSRTRKWRRSRLISEIPVQIRHGNPPSFSGGYFHWFTSDGLIVAYDPSSLDEEDNYRGRLLLQEKKHVVSVIQSPVQYSSKIVWRSDNRQTMWFAQSRLDDGVEVFRTRNDSDDWTCISSVGMDAMTDVIIGITEKDKENEVKISGEEIEEMSPDRMMVWLIAFVPWNPKLVILRYWDRIYIYDCIQKKLNRKIMLEGDRHYTDITYEWYPYFHTLSTSQVNFKQEDHQP